jgi:hypothetical protein
MSCLGPLKIEPQILESIEVARVQLRRPFASSTHLRAQDAPTIAIVIDHHRHPSESP